LGKVGLDPARVYHVRDAHIDRPGMYLTLEDGTIGFTQDILGRATALFSKGKARFWCSLPTAPSDPPWHCLQVPQSSKKKSRLDTFVSTMEPTKT